MFDICVITSLVDIKHYLLFFIGSFWKTWSLDPFGEACLETPHRVLFALLTIKRLNVRLHASLQIKPHIKLLCVLIVRDASCRLRDSRWFWICKGFAGTNKKAFVSLALFHVTQAEKPCKLKSFASWEALQAEKLHFSWTLTQINNFGKTNVWIYWKFEKNNWKWKKKM